MHSFELHVRVPGECEFCDKPLPEAVMFDRVDGEWFCPHCRRWNDFDEIEPSPPSPTPLTSFEGLEFGARLRNISNGKEYLYVGHEAATKDRHYVLDIAGGYATYKQSRLVKDYTLVEEAPGAKENNRS